jgi:hypothetical protein
MSKVRRHLLYIELDNGQWYYFKRYQKPEHAHQSMRDTGLGKRGYKIHGPDGVSFFKLETGIPMNIPMEGGV